MLREALRYPTSGDRGVEAVLVTGGLLLLAVFFTVFGYFLFFIPVFVAIACYLAVRGYYVRVIRWTTRYPERGAPPFDDWNDLLVDGLQAGVVAFVYFLPAFFLLVVALVSAEVSSVPDPSAAVGVLRSVTGVVVLVTFMYLIGVAYVLPAAVANFAYHDEFMAAFRVRELADGVLTEDYAVGWVVSLLYNVVAFPFVMVSYLLLVGFFLRGYVGIGVRHIYGRTTRAAFGFEPMAFDEADGGAGPDRPRTESGPVDGPDLTDAVSADDTRRREGLSEGEPQRGDDLWNDGTDEPAAGGSEAREKSAQAEDGDRNGEDRDPDPMEGESGRR